MRVASARVAETYAKRARLLDESVERAKVRKARALKLGNQREADGAQRTIDDARFSARRLRAMIAELSEQQG